MEATFTSREEAPMAGIVVHDAAEAIGFYQQVFGAEQLGQAVTPEGEVLYSRLRVGDTVLLVSSEWPGTRLAGGLGPNGSSLEVRVHDLAAVVQRAVRAGARRLGGESEAARLLDPFGQRWSLWPDDDEAEQGLALLACAAGR